MDENEQFIFKTSTVKMAIANKMKEGGEHFLATEFCCFDGKVKRCCNFTTLTASVYHPLLQKQIPLGIMECKSEDSTNVSRFWREFNKAYKEVNQTDEKFSPTRWISDMATANFNGLTIVYGEEVLERVKSCEFHFQKLVNKHASKFEDGEKFKVSFIILIVMF